MKHFEVKKNLKHHIYSRTTIVVLLLIILILFKGVFVLFLRFKESKNMRIQSENRLNDMLLQKESLEVATHHLDRDGGVDMEIRRKFNVAKPGERVALVVDEKKEESTTTPPSFFSVLWHKIFK